MPSLFRAWAIALGERPFANSSKMRRTIAASSVIDATFPTYGFTGSIEFAHDVITETETTSRLALTHSAFQAAPGFLSEILEE